MEQEINGKVQKINDEDYEIIKVIESKNRVDVVKWYQDNYDCNVADALVGLSSIYKKYLGDYKPSAEEAFLLAKELGKNSDKPLEAKRKAAEWLESNFGIDVNDADMMILNGCKSIVKSENGVSESKNGCMITILIAITSTLSVLCLL